MFAPYIKNVKLDPMFAKYTRACRKRVLKNNRDVCLAISGPRGIGKTLLSMVIAYLMRKSLSWDNFVFVPTPENVRHKLDNTKAGDVRLRCPKRAY